ncbi:28S ribosomal protein S18c, mitochondrial-like isoform X2 [Microtus oregoni]|uniref:28S ribosomal protein S18c, mitochondrial-like isoform X2 n=1 Tax=Microtus oregoni TaxID=111838 RepID=UPI001BB0DAB7|nr:28S ribosomal protein S18c, mitochondrial-like isoform X2 [Microtus oregoni]
MTALVAVCSGVERKSLTTAAVCLADSRAHAVLRRRCCAQDKQVASNEDLLLSKFISPFTRCIYGRHTTGLCGKKQKEITKAIKRAQKMGFKPVKYKDQAYLKDPKVCNIRYRE